MFKIQAFFKRVLIKKSLMKIKLINKIFNIRKSFSMAIIKRSLSLKIKKIRILNNQFKLEGEQEILDR